ncbi:MAG: hypothetical protein R3E04_01880 [Sphingobium sp.]
MTNYLLLIIAAIAASELLLRLPVLHQVRKITAVTRKSSATLRSNRISDHWKEMVLPTYSMHMGGCSILFFLLLCVVALPVILVGFVAPNGMRNWLSILMQPVPILILCASSLLYILARTRLSRG